LPSIKFTRSQQKTCPYSAAGWAGRATLLAGGGATGLAAGLAHAGPATAARFAPVWGTQYHTIANTNQQTTGV